jgi:hypothetical protein
VIRRKKIVDIVGWFCLFSYDSHVLGIYIYIVVHVGSVNIVFNASGEMIGYSISI